MIRVDTFGMVNLIAGRRIAPELIQSECVAERIASEVLGFLRVPERLATMRSELAAVREKLATSGDASRRAAEAVLETIDFRRDG